MPPNIPLWGHAGLHPPPRTGEEQMTRISIINNAVWITAADRRKRPVLLHARARCPGVAPHHLQELSRSQGPSVALEKEAACVLARESVHQHLSTVTAG